MFGKPNDYATPIRLVLTKLAAGAPIEDKEMVMMSLAFAMDGIQPNNGRKTSLAPIVKPGTFDDQKRQAQPVEPSDGDALFDLVTP